MPEFATVVGDSEVLLKLTLTRADGSIVDLTGLALTDIKVRVRLANDTSAVTFEEDITSIDGAPTLGEISWRTTTTIVVGGLYEIRIVVTHTSTFEETFPVKVEDRLLWTITPNL